MTNIFKKIIISFALLFVVLGPNIASAADMTLYGIQGSGTWDGNLKTFTGTTTEVNRTYNGTWELNETGGLWTGTVQNGQINGTWSGSYLSFSTNGNWVGSKINLKPVKTETATDIGNTYATLNGNYVVGNFDRVYFRYGKAQPLPGTTFPRNTEPASGPGDLSSKKFSERIAGLDPSPDPNTNSTYYFQFCGIKNNKESCGNMFSFVTNLPNNDPNFWNVVNSKDANSANKDTDTTYTFLEPLSKDLKEFDSSQECSFATYANLIINIFIGICAVLAMVMIVSAGLQYMTSALSSSKSEAKSTIENALLGLVIILAAYLVLNTLNPKLLELCINNKNTLPEAISLEDLGGESPDPFKEIEKGSLQSLGISSCNETGGKAMVETIGRQFIGKTIYSQAPGKRNTISGNKIILDCSAYVAQVYKCAGLPYPGGNSTEMFSIDATKVDGSTFNFNTLNPGDLIGWTPADDPRGNGHVAIYLGNGKILDTQNTKNASNVTNVRNLDSIKNRVKYVKWPK